MNATDLYTLLASPPISRGAFFTQLLSEPGPPHEKPLLDPLADSPAEPAAPQPSPGRPTATGFPA